jgi:hypothetical protein
VTVSWILLANFCPGPAEECPARMIALVESECMVMCRYGEDLSHLTAASMAATSGSKAVCLVSSVLAPWAMMGPAPMSSSVMIHPSPADLRKKPSVHAWQASISGISGLLAIHGVGRRGRGEVFSMFSQAPSLINRPLSEASKNCLGIRWRLELSSECAGSRAFFGVPAGAAMTEINSRSLLLSRMGSAGGVSAVRIASSPLVVLNVPATVLPIATVSL